MEQDMRKIPWKVVIPVAAVLVLGLLILIFRVTEITVEGNTFYSQDVVANEVCNSFLDKNTITSFVRHRLGFGTKLPYVRECEVSYPGVHRIHIKLYEKTIVAGIVYMNQYIYFDKDGMVLKSTNEALPEVPLFETNSVTTFTLYDQVKMEDTSLLEQIRNLSHLFQTYDVPWDRVVFDEKNAAYLYSGNVQVRLGKKDNYDQQISALSGVLKTSLEKNLSGEIDMTNYYFGGDIILKQNK